MAQDQAAQVSARGGCLCGKTRFEIVGELRPVVSCHCGQCRRWHGHFAAYTAVGKDRLTITRGESFTWYRSSDQAQRGFCRDCGSSLFWQPDGRNHLAVAAGALDAPSGLQTARHIFVADKGDYYELDGDAERFLQGGDKVPMPPR